MHDPSTKNTVHGATGYQPHTTGHSCHIAVRTSSGKHTQQPAPTWEHYMTWLEAQNSSPSLRTPMFFTQKNHTGWGIKPGGHLQWLSSLLALKCCTDWVIWITGEFFYFWQCYEVIDAGGSQIRDVQGSIMHQGA